jgi:hypothetical protein
MNLKHRTAELEAKMTDELESIKISRFILDLKEPEPIGYRCLETGIEIIRQEGESQEALQARCSNSVAWGEVNRRVIFVPLEREPKATTGS